MSGRRAQHAWGWVATVAVGVGMAAVPASAQQWSWPERAENLQELPADFPAERLSAVMRGFTNALGVRCSHCHVGEEGQPLSEYDFASDDNPNKVTARSMLTLLGAVNDHLDDIEPTGEEVNMWCHTCHNGKPRPQTLSEAVGERYRAEGPDAAFAYFRELRDLYYGGVQYDFTARNVGQLAAGLLQQGDTVTAQRLFEVNLEDYPGSAVALEGMGDIMRVTGMTDDAIGYYERALEVSPGNRSVTAKLERIR
jgi:tetratricopeptide (TPR) repeat protein